MRLNVKCYLGKPFGKQTVTIYLNQMGEFILILHLNGNFLSQRFAQTCFTSARWSMQQNHSITGYYVLTN